MDQYLQKLKKAKLSNTKPRQAIFNILKNSGHKAFSMNDLVNVSRIFADRSTVYRSVYALEEAGIVKKIYHNWKYKVELSDDFFGHHHHLICQKCHKIWEIEVPQSTEKELQKQISFKKFQISGHTIEFYGLCEQCQAS